MSTPRILMWIDMYGWAFHALAKGMKKYATGYDIEIRSAKENIDFNQYDLIHAFGAYQNCDDIQSPVLKGIYNTNASIRNRPVSELMRELTEDATAITVPTSSMEKEIRSFGIDKPMYMLPEGVDIELFPYTPPPRSTLKVGWAGNPLRCYKRFALAQEACNGICDLHVADGTLSEAQVIEFYTSLDVILCTSEIGEGCPRPLIEAMSCGCFPVSFPVGVAPDIITHEQSGLLVKDESIEGMHNALLWCHSHQGRIRSVRKDNHNFIADTRSWPTIAPTLTAIYDSVLQQ
jgi:hypothetical protein